MCLLFVSNCVAISAHVLRYHAKGLHSKKKKNAESQQYKIAGKD